MVPALAHRFRIPLALVALLFVAALVSCTVPYDDPGLDYVDDESAYDDEYSPRADWGMFADLDFYGQWFWVEPYGWTWRPTVVFEWRPFLHGHWIWTEYGWTWVSYEPFGWATCHYGWWAYEFGLGWIWIPDYDWYPHRVDWVLFGDYVCWAPLPYPDYYWNDPWIQNDYDIWCVIDREHFAQDDVGRFHRPPRFKSTYSPLRHQPPERGTIERRMGGSIKPVKLLFETRTVSGNEFHRMILPPDQLDRLNDYEAREQDSFKRAYRERYGLDPNSPAVNDSDWTRTRKPQPPGEPREAKRKVETRDNKAKPDTQSDDNNQGNRESKQKQKEPAKKQPAKAKEKLGGKGKG